MKLHTKPKPSVIALIKSALDQIDHHQTQVTGIEVTRSEANRLVEEANNLRGMYVPEYTFEEAFLNFKCPIIMSGVPVYLEGHVPDIHYQSDQ